VVPPAVLPVPVANGVAIPGAVVMPVRLAVGVPSGEPAVVDNPAVGRRVPQRRALVLSVVEALPAEVAVRVALRGERHERAEMAGDVCAVARSRLGVLRVVAFPLAVLRQQVDAHDDDCIQVEERQQLVVSSSAGRSKQQAGLNAQASAMGKQIQSKSEKRVYFS